MGNSNSVSTWDRLEKIGEGGNGEVWRARRDGIECALKILKTKREDGESYRRFIDEIGILRELEDDPGVLPILDANLPESPSKGNRAWLSMPLATGIRNALGSRPRIESVIEAIAAIAETLSRLAKNDICHRDVKPENLYQFEDRWVIGDFGLADFPNKDDVTEEGRALGPRFYIAPEMVRDPMGASGFPADVWSLAKTMWVLATGQNFPPPHPQLASDPRDALAVLFNHPRVFSLDNLIERATNKEADERLSMADFATDLQSWIAVANEPISELDVSDVTNQIRLLSRPYFDDQSRMEKCREAAKLAAQPLPLQLEDLREQLRSTGLQCGLCQGNGNSLLKGSGIATSNQAGHAVSVVINTPPPLTHTYECGILIQVLNDRRHIIHAAHLITHHGGKAEIVWSETHEVDSGSSHEQCLVNQLVQKLYSNLKLGLERFANVIS